MSEAMKPCPFCGKKVDLEDDDTLYPSGTGWKFDEQLQMRTYHRMHEVPDSQRCYVMHCPVQVGGCGAEMHGDTRTDAIANWNMRNGNELADLRTRCEKAEKRLEYVTTNIDTVAAGQCYETQDDFYAAIDAAIAKERK